MLYLSPHALPNMVVPDGDSVFWIKVPIVVSLVLLAVGLWTHGALAHKPVEALRCRLK